MASRSISWAASLREGFEVEGYVVSRRDDGCPSIDTPIELRGEDRGVVTMRGLEVSPLTTGTLETNGERNDPKLRNNGY